MIYSKNHFMKYVLNIFSLIFIFYFLNACSFFNTETISSQQIINKSKWLKSDQFPSFPECEDLELNEQKECFESNINFLVMDYINSKSLKAIDSINGKVTLVIKIDKEGVFSISEIIDKGNIIRIIPDLNLTLEEAINTLPNALPAVKTNVGIYVSTKMQLPIQIKAFP